MPLFSLSGLSDLLDGDRTILALVPALSVGYLHFQTKSISFETMRAIVVVSAVIAGVSKDTELITRNFNIGFNWVAKNIVLIPIVLATFSLHGYAVWQLFKYGGGSRLYIIIFTIQVLATTILVSDIVLVLMVRSISFMLRLLMYTITLTSEGLFKLRKEITD